jgi:hypothetical protein
MAAVDVRRQRFTPLLSVHICFFYPPKKLDKNAAMPHRCRRELYSSRKGRLTNVCSRPALTIVNRL